MHFDVHTLFLFVEEICFFVCRPIECESKRLVLSALMLKVQKTVAFDLYRDINLRRSNAIFYDVHFIVSIRAEEEMPMVSAPNSFF